MNNKITAKHTFKSILYLLIFLSLALTACLDDSAVSYNEYSISSITTPVDDLSSKAASSDKKVYIGHSLPVNVELTAKYDEDDIPIQFYLLNVDDVNDVDDGIAFIEDMRMYYCYQSSLTTIDHIEEGTNKYGLVINVPADQSKDEFTGDFKVGTYYVVAEVDKNQRSEINPYIIYTKYKDILDESNTISIATDYMKKPDLSVEGLFFTGEQDYPNDVVTFYNLDLSELPGAENAGLELMYIKPSIADRTFSGTVHVRSSSSDALNVPISFYLESEDGEVTVPLEIYDRSMEGYVEDYYIKILRKNTTERISLRLRIPDDIGNLDYFSESNYDNWESETQKEDYPLSALRHKIDKEDYGDHTFKIKAVVNEDGSVKETRFIIPNSDNSEYNEDDFIEDGNENGASTLANNTKTENLILSLEKIDVEPNEGVVFYPYSKLDPPDPDYKNLVIFWLGLGENIGDDLFGGILEVHGGMFFRNYSFFSMGYEATLHISKYEMGAQLFLNAESHPFDGDESFYDFFMTDITCPVSLFLGNISEISDETGEHVQLYSFSDTQKGFDDHELIGPRSVDSPEVTIPIEAVGTGVEIKIGGKGYYCPLMTLRINEDGSLRISGGVSLLFTIHAAAEVSVLDNLTIGLKGEIELFYLDFLIGCYTKTYYSNATENLGKVRGSLAIGPEIWITGPSGTLTVYAEIFGMEILNMPFISFQSGKWLIYEDTWAESDKTTWNDVENSDLINYEYEDLNLE